MVKYMFVKVQD